jgi:DNA (cytosine-5)-methyltransferase 1
MAKTLKFIDLFAGLGGLRIGLEQAADTAGLKAKCVFTSEIKPSAIEAYCHNFPGEFIHGDIASVATNDIPDFDVLLAGFPCQPFSSAGNRLGFADTRGTLFFEIERILRDKKPTAFILENVEGLVTHDRRNPKDKIGNTLQVILSKLEELGYLVSWSVFDASKFGLPQKRKRVYIVGSKKTKIDLSGFENSRSILGDVLEKAPSSSLQIDTLLTRKLLAKFDLESLQGLQIKDKRGGANNIHSWDLELKGSVNARQRELMERILRQRRRKSWAESKGIPWADGMPLSVDEIATFTADLFDRKDFRNHLKKELEDLRHKGYLAFEAPKKGTSHPGYNIVVGKLSFDISHILDSKSQTPTLVATDVTRLAVTDKKMGFRRLSVREGLRLFGFPDTYEIPETISYSKAFDLLGNSVTLNVVQMVSERVLRTNFYIVKLSPDALLKASLQVSAAFDPR